ncbi:MAG: Ni/Fe hydrogenase subunit alpha [Coriobacteriales bacterium]|nr:Ni/Fe hydrogenase subunit alpha [Coriobacteriales bacterium]
MTDTMTLSNVTRIEGHGRITLQLDERDSVAGATFDALEFRGFEAFLEGRMVWEMPLLTSRVCGVCPVSHHVASVLAVEDLFGAEPPRAAQLQREALHLAGLIQDHALHFFFLAGPDFLTGDGSGSRDLLGVIEADPELARRAIALRRGMQRAVEIVGGRPGQPVTCIPGGMSRALSADQLDELRSLAADAVETASVAEGIATEATTRLLDENPGYAIKPFYNMSLVDADGAPTLIGGRTLRIVDPNGGTFAEFDVADYSTHLAEEPSPTSFAMQPYLASLGPAEGRYRVGPLARLNMTESMTGSRAAEAFEDWRTDMGAPEHRVLAFHRARMVEMLAAVERLGNVLADDEIASDNCRVAVDRFSSRGVGAAAIEAPRGTLIHRYEADPVGKVTSCDLRVATTHNARSIDTAVLAAVRGRSAAEASSEELVRRMELGIRAHDPCLSCATHEVGAMPLVVDVVAADGAHVMRRGV